MFLFLREYECWGFCSHPPQRTFEVTHSRWSEGAFQVAWLFRSGLSTTSKSSEANSIAIQTATTKHRQQVQLQLRRVIIPVLMTIQKLFGDKEEARARRGMIMSACMESRRAGQREPSKQLGHKWWKANEQRANEPYGASPRASVAFLHRHPFLLLISRTPRARIYMGRSGSIV